MRLLLTAPAFWVKGWCTKHVLTSKWLKNSLTSYLTLTGRSDEVLTKDINNFIVFECLLGVC